MNNEEFEAAKQAMTESTLAQLEEIYQQGRILGRTQLLREILADIKANGATDTAYRIAVSKAQLAYEAEVKNERKEES